LVGEVRRHRVDVVGEILPGPGHSGHLRLAPELAVGATSRATRDTSEANPFNWSTIVLIVLFNSRISPFTSTVIFFERSPLATAVVTSAMLRT